MMRQSAKLIYLKKVSQLFVSRDVSGTEYAPVVFRHHRYHHFCTKSLVGPNGSLEKFCQVVFMVLLLLILFQQLLHKNFLTLIGCQ